ncbi:MAG: hypothetical protein M1827_005646 [Pycnora praestabilis]|nr:MAG: hypothetical protein M1827_005646 [Pycnora praestabilis]
MANKTQGSFTNHSPLWDKALERYREELKDVDDYNGAMDVGSMEELLSQARALEPPGHPSKTLSSLNRLEPTLVHMNDFSAVIALFLGADAKTAGLVWGSIRIILTLALPAGDMLPDVLNMLEELSMSLPRFRAYENTLPMNDALETSLLASYTEMTCFCARTINFFRSNPHHVLRRKSWASFDGDFKQTIKRLKRLSQLVDSEADAARMRADGARNAEILAVMQSLQGSTNKGVALPCYHVPFGINERFYGRQEVLRRIRNSLIPQERNSQPLSFALHGMGGVGKTQIALHYANSCRSEYDAILWISADSSIKMSQSFLKVAQHLGLVSDDQEAQDSAAAVSKMKAWLAETSCRSLIIFDNADDLEILKHAWPGSGKGSILLTSRDSSAAFSPASDGFHVKPFDNLMGSAVLLSLVGQDPDSGRNQSAAKDITKALGGLPLAINQISGFLVQQKLSLEAFLPLYERNSSKIHARKSALSDYDHSLNTVWEIALNRLSGDARSLQSLLCFFDPDRIYESILVDGSEGIKNGDFHFLADEMDFFDAKEVLLRAALVERTADDGSLSVHRLVQSVVLARLSPPERVESMDYAIKLLGKGFPNTWQSDIGHQFSTWTRCEMCLPHKPSYYMALLTRHVRYLYEREVYDEALEMIRIALQHFDDTSTLAHASAVDLLGLLELDTNNAEKALLHFSDALRIRESSLGSENALIASSLNNIALAYTELAELEQAVAFHQKAINIRLRTQSDRIGNSYSNLSSTLLRMGKADEAEEVLARCPSLKDFNDETFLITGNPRFSGDMVLLSRIRLQQGRLDDAIRLGSKALAFRQGMLGNRLKTCDSLYLVATLLWRRGNSASAIKLLQESVLIAECLSEGKGYLARSNFMLGQIYATKGDLLQSQRYKDAARKLRLGLQGDVLSANESEDSYDRLVVWMLW